MGRGAIYGSIPLLATAWLLSTARLTAAGSIWTVSRSSRFEVYSDAGTDHASATLRQFEELRSFFANNDLIPASSSAFQRPVRVIQFASKAEYREFALRATADAYYTGTADRDYIVMPLFGADGFGLAAHEYAHFLLHSAGLEVPAWLSEGLAEVFSTARVANNRCEFGGVIRAHIDTLQRARWVTPSDLFTANLNSELRATRSGAALFYAESWAITSTLVFSPEYAPLFSRLIETFATGKLNSSQAIAAVYHESPESLLKAAEAWIATPRITRRGFTAMSSPSEAFATAQVPNTEIQLVLADLLSANGEWSRAKQMYLQLLAGSPHDAEILAALGTVSLRERNRRGAIEYWGSALANGVTDADLCFRYAVLADQMNMPAGQIEQALELAVRLKPNFDDARFQLALLQSNKSDFAGAVMQLHAMARPSQQRAFAYWIALAYALCQLGRRDEAKSAAEEASAAARSAEERARAAQIAYEAGTDLAVRFARDANGNPQLVTTRVPHGSTDFNPFVEASDNLQVATGKLVAAQCTAGKLSAFIVQTQTATLTLSLPDPAHIMIRNGPQDFYCGAQDGRAIKVEYAAAAKPDTGILRGMDFR